MRRVFIIIGLLLIPAIPIVLVVTGVIKKKPQSVNQVSLTVWGTSDTATDFAPVIAKFRVQHPYVKISYKQVSKTDYQNQLLQAWAQGTGPDLFFVPSQWVKQMSAYATAQPASLTIPVVTTSKGIFGEQQTVSSPSQPAPSVSTVQQSFVDVVSEDIIFDGKIWGYPLSMDSIALYSNKDLLNNAKIFEPAKTWAELTTQVVNNKLTLVDDQQAIVQSGVALGTTNNVPYGTSLLTLLMMQNGAQMINTSGRTAFQQSAGLTALNFFTSFSRPNKETYSWNMNQSNALDAFTKGKVAYFFGTLADQEKIAKSGIKWQVSPMLHIDERGDKDGLTGATRFMNLAEYEIGMVSKAATTARRGTVAWNFLQFMSRSSNVTNYLTTTGKLSAIKKVLTDQKDDPKFGVFADQLLTAESWYHGNNATAVDGYFQQMITSILKDGADPQAALNIVASQVQASL